MLPLVVAVTVVLMALAFRFYGRFLARRCGLDDARATPAHTERDGVDYVPTRASVVFGHHFSSIAGSGPIVGPILAGLYFGWGPAWLWVLVGAIFIGGVHDFGAAFMSVRSRGRSIAQISAGLVGQPTARLFLVFALLALIYVIVVFLDLTADTFVNSPVVATASGWFVLMALAFGVVTLRLRLRFGWAVAVFVPLTFLGLGMGEWFPAPPLGKETWLALLLVYCLGAAVAPVNVLLQPRDFLSSFFLYAVLLAGVVGVFVALPAIEGDFFRGWTATGANPASLVPALFITVACGACSGFHSMVASGTTSKQIARESDIKRVGYGAMLVEGVLATLALGTLVVLTAPELAAAGNNPVRVFAAGLAKILAPFGVAGTLATDFALLAVSTFLLTTLDTCTRLCRFLVEELLGWRSKGSRYLGTAAVLVVPALLVFRSFDGRPVWQIVWPLFGSTNQLLAALALVTLVVYLRRERIRAGFAVVPAAVMMAMPMTALAMMAWSYGPFSLLGGISAGMFLLGGMVIGRCMRVLWQGRAVADATPVPV
jgi:carbon starvation protein